MDKKDYERYESLAEVMEVVKIVEVIHAETGKAYRLEVIKHLVGTASVHYAVHYYENVRGPGVPGTGNRVWTEYLNFPWIRQDTADAALAQALSFVNDRPQRGSGEPEP